jgi:hypothetical protein
MRRLAFSLLAVALIAAVPALAQEEPPARVGRVSFVSGQLGFHTAGETAWSAAAVNYPVATGGSFWADRNRAPSCGSAAGRSIWPAIPSSTSSSSISRS